MHGTLDELPKAICEMMEQCGLTNEMSEEEIMRAITASEEYMAFTSYQNPPECSDSCGGTSLLTKALKGKRSKRK
jgi:hypothetical protein